MRKVGAQCLDIRNMVGASAEGLKLESRFKFVYIHIVGLGPRSRANRPYCRHNRVEIDPMGHFLCTLIAGINTYIVY